MSTIATTGVAPPPRMLLPQARSRWPVQITLCLGALLWYGVADALAGRAARGITNRFDLEDGRQLLAAAFLIFLLLVGYTLLGAVARTGRVSLRSAFGLPQRPTALREWTLGAAIGWGAAVAAVLPMTLAAALHVHFWTGQRALVLLAWNLATLALTSLATEMALRGYPFRLLIQAIGPGWATAMMAAGLGFLHWFSPEANTTSVLVTMCFAVVLAVAWLRTHGLWLGWGLHFAWNASIALLFGLPLRGVSGFASVVQTRAVRPGWLTGESFGPEGAVFTAVVFLGALIVLVRATGDYAWDYTRPEIVAAGYPVDPALPAAHVAIEQEVAVRPPALVQILPITSQSRSVDGP